MKTALLALSLVLLGACAAPSGEEEIPDTQSEALRDVGGGGSDSPESCLAAQQACYKSCAPSGSSSCYRYCDILYTKCRGLPSPELSFSIR